MKRALVIIGAVLVAVGLFYGGWMLRENRYNSEFNAAVEPAQDLTDNLVAQNASAAYELMPAGYKSNVSKDKFKADVAAKIPKDYKQSGLSIYQGANESLINFDISDKAGKVTGTLMVFTTKEGDKWQVNYAQFNQK